MSPCCGPRGLGPGRSWRRGGGGSVPPAVLLASLDARSDALQGLVAGIPGIVQPFPATAGACTALGWTSPTNLFLCDESSGNLVDKIAAVALPPHNSPLQGRSLVGVAQSGGLASKASIETPGETYAGWTCATTGPLDVATEDFTFSFFARFGTYVVPNAYLISKKPDSGGTGYNVRVTATQVTLQMAAAGDTNRAYAFACALFDGASHLVTISVDRSGNAALYVDGQATQLLDVSLSAASLSYAIGVSLGIYSATDPENFPGQIAWVYFCKGSAEGRAPHDATWKHAVAAGLTGATPTYTRAGSLWVPGGAQVFDFAAGQAAFGISSALAVTDGNALQTGLPFENAIPWLGLDSRRMWLWTATNSTRTRVDGPNGMLSAVRVVDADGTNAGYVSSGSATISGNSAVPHTLGCWLREVAAGGNDAVVTAYFAGDGGGAEELIVVSLAGTVPSTWKPYSGTVTPTRPGHTSVVLRCYPTDAVGASTGTVDFAKAWGWRGPYVPLVGMTTAAGAAVSSAVPALSLANTGNAILSPARGSIALRLAGLATAQSQTSKLYDAATGVRPYGVAIDVARDHGYSADYTDGTVTCWLLSTGANEWTTAVGTSPTGICVDLNGNVWVCCQGDSKIIKLTSAGVYVSETAVDSPLACTPDALGNIWVADSAYGNAVKIRASDGASLGTYPCGSSPYGIAVHPTTGEIWVCNYLAVGTATRLSAAGALIDTYSTGTYPHGIAIDAVTGEVWASCPAGDCITVLSSVGAPIRTVTTPQPINCATASDGTIWATDDTNNALVSIDSVTGDLLGSIPLDGTHPVGLAVGGGSVYVAPYYNNWCCAYRVTPAVLATSTMTAAGKIYDVVTGGRCHDIVCDASRDHGYSADYLGGSVSCWQLSTGTILWTLPIYSNMVGICLDLNGDVWATNDDTDSVYQISPAGVLLRTVDILGTVPFSIAADSLGHVITANAGDDSISIVTVATGAVAGPYTVGESPYGVAVHPTTGEIWVCNYLDNSLGTGGTVTRLTAAGALIDTYATGSHPHALCIDPVTGDVWISNATDGTMTVLSSAGAPVAVYPVGELAAPSPIGCASDGNGGIWIADSANNVLVKLSSSTGVQLESLALTGTHPVGVACDGSSVYVTNYYNDWVSRYAINPVFLSAGAEGARGALVLDYAGQVIHGPLQITAAQLRGRAWDNAQALAAIAFGGDLTSAQHDLAVRWNAAGGRLQLYEDATLLGSNSPAAWTPSAVDVTPVYVGADSSGTHAARAWLARLQTFDR